MLVAVLPITAKSEDVLSIGPFLPNDFFFSLVHVQILFPFIDRRIFFPPFKLIQ